MSPWAETCSDNVQPNKRRYAQWNVSELFAVCFCCAWQENENSPIKHFDAIMLIIVQNVYTM
jgi:hypothetical protein